jgi:hypothetical protein
MFVIKSDSKGDYLYRKVKPVVYLEDMLETITYFKNPEGLPSNLRVLEDARDIKVKFGIKVVPDIIKEAIQVMSQYEIVKHAIVYNSAVYTAYGLLAEKIVSTQTYSIKAFSSISAARSWLEIDEEEVL